MRSTLALRDWLLTLRPTDLLWFEAVPPGAEPAREDPNAPLIAKLLETCRPADEPVRELAGQLLGFHVREAKPEWWAMFDRQLRPEDDLMEDLECLGGLERVGVPRLEKKSLVYSYRYPEQDTKLRVGSDVKEAATLQGLGKIGMFDEQNRLVEVSRGKDRDPPGMRLSLIPAGPIGTDEQQAALRRLASAIVDGTASRYNAVLSLLRREAPGLSGRVPGASILPADASHLAGAIGAVSALNGSYLFIQGPPGTGKTYTAARAIVALMAAGKRVGVTSNSHKAIHNLLDAIERAAVEGGLTFRGLKKADRAKEETRFEGRFVTSVFDNDAVDPEADLIAGTSWLFSCAFLDQALDYLFVDEAGQVALANAAAMGLSALNLVLVGDQMQLGQPIKGSHPGSSGVSVLEHLLGDQRVIPPDRGIFLGTTWRMHPDLCGFISEAVYDGQLRPEAGTVIQRLRLGADAHPELKPAGLAFWPVTHEGCGQKSEAEGREIAAIVQDLLRHEVTDRHGVTRPVTLADVLVVAPYNVQVNYLRSVLPDGARVGTVDRFQGQEGEVVIISMTTSSGAEMPRDIEFLFSRNRLNVALSRAKCLSIIVASPLLLEVDCSSVEELRLVSTLCWAEAYAASSPASPIGSATRRL